MPSRASNYIQLIYLDFYILCRKFAALSSSIIVFAHFLTQYFLAGICLPSWSVFRKIYIQEQRLAFTYFNLSQDAFPLNS